MRKRGERYLLILPLLIVFCCLLLSGGSRLIGREGEETVAVQLPPALRGVLCVAPARPAETGCVSVLKRTDSVQTIAEAMIHERPDASVCSDANGNVLRQETYLHAVYQAFSLGDGFV
ncbi:MAG: hypothetical protein IKK34_12240 [Clostridia bacterium]|nr:hypothetical protein [Clostridia bacterium]